MATDESSLELHVAPPPTGRSGPPRPPPLPKRRTEKKDAAPSVSDDQDSQQTSAEPRVITAATPIPEPPPSVLPSKVLAPAARDDDTSPDADDSPQRGASEEIAVPRRQRWLRGFGSALCSTIVHLVVLVALALWVFPQVASGPAIFVDLSMDESQEEIATFELQQSAESMTEMMVVDLTSSVGTAGSGVGSVGEVALDQKMVEQAADVRDINIDAPLSDAPTFRELVTATPDGALGDSRAIVDDYDQAMSRITSELMWMLDKSRILLIWSFDQSESMKDDQEAIRARIARVYADLRLTRKTSEVLTTAVTSYGQGFVVHTDKPTSDSEEIRAAIESVPSDPSGKEMMCSAITASIARFHEYATSQKRQIILIVVSDETGEREDNIHYIEPTIAAAQKAKCRLYFLGREAVFGYPYAHMKWQHPITGHVHWLPVDRGPETAFVEQLQTDGFRRRYDAFPSGFGPYEQTRMARETGGIFFMLPGLETTLVRGELRRYELEAMEHYKPDLRPRATQLVERNQSALRSMLWKIVNDLNPYDEKVAEVMEVRFTFSAQPETFATQVRTEQAKIKVYLQYLDAAAKAMEEIKYHRRQEVSPRWQANYDLVYAQIIAYTARTYEYGAYLEQFINNPKMVPFEKPNYLRLSHWTIEHSSNTVGGDLTKDYIERSAAMFQQIIQEHPGTPWAARAEWELSRGFGYELHEGYSYYGPRPPQPPRYTGPPIPIPKL